MVRLIIESEYMTCTKCKLELPATEEYYYKQKTKNKDGVVFYRLVFPCKECRKEYGVKRTQAKGYKEKQKRYHASWSIQNRDREAENKRRLRRDNPEHYKKYFKNYQSNNISRFSEYARKRKANKKFIITKKEWESCKAYFNSSCAYCGLSEEQHKETFKTQLHQEHVVNYGKNNLKNCVPSCKECSSQKSTYSLHTWYNKDNDRYSDERYSKIYNWIRYDANKSMKNYQVRF